MSNPDNPNQPPTALEADGTPKPHKWSGGPDTHKPTCMCNTCVSRRRKKEALALGIGPNAPATALQQTKGEVLSDAPPTTGKSSKLQRERIAKWLTWKAVEPKLTQAEAAERLGIAPQTLTNLIHLAAKEGWLQFVDPFAELEYKQIPLVNQVINRALEGGNEDVAVKMAQATIWKQYAASKGVTESAPSMVLALKIEMPPGVVASDVPIKGVIVGSPRTIDAEIIESKDE